MLGIQVLNILAEISNLMIILVLNVLLLILSLKLTAFFIRKSSHLKYGTDKKKGCFTVGFFHPFCNSGGGGERVLWSAVKVIQDK